MRVFLLLLLGISYLTSSADYPYVSYNGMYNNPSNIGWGRAGSPLSHPIRPQYADGTSSTDYPGRASARDISLALFQESTRVPLSDKYTALLPYFMEFVNHDILQMRGSCPPESVDIPVRENDPVYENQGDMPLDRAQYQHYSGVWADYPRQHINSVTSWIDASHVYGVSKGWADILRSGSGGKLESSPRNSSLPALNRWGVPLDTSMKPHNCLYPDIKKQFLFGDTRSNFDPGVYSLHWLMFSEHNRMAEQLNETNPGMNDKWLFDKSRYLTMALYQKITFDALQDLLGPLRPYRHYRPSLNPGISFLYAGAVQFFFHTMIPDLIFTSSDGNCTHSDPPLRLCNTMWDAQDTVERYGGPQAVLRGLSHQRAAEIDTHIVPDIRSRYYGPRHWTRRDGIAMAIQRGRDLGVPPLNTVLQYYSLRPMSWEDWEAELPLNMVSNLKHVYARDVNQVELFVGGMLLNSTRGGQMSEVFRRIMMDQFLSLRDGDRFWWENLYNGLGSTLDEMVSIRSTTLRDVLERNGVYPPTGNADVFTLSGVGDECVTDTNKLEIPECEGGMMFHYNYNTAPYAIPILLPLFVVFTVFLALVVNRIMWYRLRMRNRKDEESSSCEWGRVEELQSRDGNRIVKITLDSVAKTLVCKAKEGQQKVVQWRKMPRVHVVSCTDCNRSLLICVPKDYDLLLKFSSSHLRVRFIQDLTRFSDDCNVTTELRQMSRRDMMKVAKTEARRQELVDAFLSSVFAELMTRGGDSSVEGVSEEGVSEEGVSGGTPPTHRGTTPQSPQRRKSKSTGVERSVMECELTRDEFASALGLRPQQEFVEKVFPMVDRDNSGTVSYREFLNFMIVYSSGSFNNKLSLFFNMYDYDQSGSLSVVEVKSMIRSMLEMVSASVGQDKLDQLISSLFELEDFRSKSELTFADFKRIMSRYERDISRAQIKGANGGGGQRVRKPTKSDKSFTATPIETKGLQIKRYIENNRLQIFYSIMYFLIVSLLFIERFITYSQYKFHTGYPQLLGYSLSFTRGSAAVLMFNFPIFLLLMCKNTLTHLRRTFLKRFIPIDSNRSAHMALGYITLLFIIIHVVGHGYNFYQISTLSPDHLDCLMPKTWLSGTGEATITGLLFGTITGITGILLVVLILIMIIFSTDYARHHVYLYFWRTHHLYPVVLLLMVLHGTARLLQEPSFHYYLIGPAIIFTMDKMLSVSKNKREIPLLQANILPSEVTNLVFKRPLDFHYMAGQYVRIALVNSGTGRDEYHPFTLTSAPHEDYLSVHIRTCKGWTKVLRDLVIKNQKTPEKNPNLYVDGPFGEAHQDYSNYEVVILVGGGIGVTPFASILKDLIHKATSLRSNLTKVRKVYFLWSTRSQKQFEWLNDIIEKCEEEDKIDVLDTHIFITRFYEKSDLRTTMLYICERQFQRLSNRSLFTGLKAVTHFGRPNFDGIFEHIRQSHIDVKKFGVFVCGPPAMSDSVQLACSKVTGKQIFVPYAESF